MEKHGLSYVDLKGIHAAIAEIPIDVLAVGIFADEADPFVGIYSDVRTRRNGAERQDRAVGVPCAYIGIAAQVAEKGVVQHALELELQGRGHVFIKWMAFVGWSVFPSTDGGGR